MICAITSTFKINDEINFTNFSNTIADILDNVLESGDYKLDTKITKEKTQLHIPIGIKLNGHEILYRTRHVNYTQNGRLRSNFRNQICLYYTNEKKKKRCFKFFCNGNIHITGYNDISCMDSDVVLLYEKLHFLIDSTQLPLSIIEKKIHMINLSFKISININLNILETNIRNKQWTPVYEPEIYCALVLHTDFFKAIIFKTGSIIITGCKSMEQLQRGFSVLLEFLNEVLV